MVWPNALITELASRRCIIFLGAGASAGSLSHDDTRRPPTWNQLLEGLIASMNNNDDEAIIREYITKEKYLDVAEMILENVSPADFSTFLRRELLTPRYKPSRIHESVLEIDPKIVITTNYDDIYDNFCRTGAAQEGYNIARYYDSHLTTDLRSPIRSIIKAHGCISDPAKVVLTKSQFFKARQEYLNFYKVLDALFLTHTILFIGYSLNDPDIQLVLENANISAASAHPHYFVTSNNLNGAIKEANKKAYNIEFIEYVYGDYDELNNGLFDLSELVKSQRQANPSI